MLLLFELSHAALVGISGYDLGWNLYTNDPIKHSCEVF